MEKYVQLLKILTNVQWFHVFAAVDILVTVVRTGTAHGPTGVHGLRVTRSVLALVKNGHVKIHRPEAVRESESRVTIRKGPGIPVPDTERKMWHAHTV